MNPTPEDELVVLVSAAGGASTAKSPSTNQGAKRGRNGGNSSGRSDAGPALQVLGLRSGVSRATYLRGTSVTGGLCVIPTHEGPVLLSSQRDTRFINAWHAGKEAVDLRCAMPERVGPLATSSDGAFLVAGASSGKCLVWDLHTGELLRIWEAHLRAVTKVVFSQDNSVFVTTSEDASVHAWDLGQVVGCAAAGPSARSNTGRITPVIKWNGHSLPVTDVHIGVGSGMDARVVSCSLDHTCRVWSLATRALVGTLSFPSQLSAGR
jgi:pre-rRNA-processing protein IPI3